MNNKLFVKGLAAFTAAVMLLTSFPAAVTAVNGAAASGYFDFDGSITDRENEAAFENTDAAAQEIQGSTEETTDLSASAGLIDKTTDLSAGINDVPSDIVSLPDGELYVPGPQLLEEDDTDKFRNGCMPSMEDRIRLAQPLPKSSLSRAAASETLIDRALRNNLNIRSSARMDSVAMAAYKSLDITEESFDINKTKSFKITADWADAFKAKAAEITSGKTTDKDKAKAIHDWVAKNVYYDYDVFEDRADRDSNAAVSVYNEILTNGRATAVCEGYARLFRALCRAAGIPCIYVEGLGSNSNFMGDGEEKAVYLNILNHAWNEVYYEGAWHVVDCTWDSPKTYNRNGNGGFQGSDYVSQSYFNISDEIFAQSHLTTYFVNENLTSFVTAADLTNGVYTFPSSPVQQYIYSDMFSGLKELTGIVIPAGVQIMGIGTNAFKKCINLASVTIPASVKSIGYQAFVGCSSLESIKVDPQNSYYASINDNTLYTSDYKALFNIALSAVNEDVVIHDNTVYIDEYRMQLNSTVKTVSIGKSYTSSSYYNNNGVQKLRDYMCTMLNGWEALESITVSAENPAYYSQDGILYSKSKKYLLKWPDCLSSVSVTLPVEFQEFYALGSSSAVQYPYNSQTLKSISIDTANPTFTAENGVLYSKDKKKIVLVPPQCDSERVYYYDEDGVVGQSELYHQIAVPPYTFGIFTMSKVKSILLDNVTRIADGAFQRTDIEGIYGTENITDIGASAFFSCIELREANFPNAVNIGASAFSACGKLNQANFPKAVNIGEFAFANCVGLQSVSLPNASSIPTQAFMSCQALQSADISKASSIGLNAFKYCSALKNVKASNAQTLEQDAFRSCSALQTIELPKAVTIGTQAFMSCSALERIELLSAETIGFGAFYECSLLQYIELPRAATIGEQAFYKCSTLKYAELPKAATIGKNAFLYCSALEYVDISNVKEVGNQAFWCGLKGIAVPKSCTVIGQNAFMTEVGGGKGKVMKIYTSSAAPVRQNSNYKQYEGSPYYSDLVGNAPAIKQDTTADEIDNTLSVQVYGFNMTYQWYKNTAGTNNVSVSQTIPGATGRTYSNGIADGATYYFCKITSKDGTDAAVTILSTPIKLNAVNPEGDCGAGMRWEFDLLRNSLTISGSGAIDDYTAQSPAPWTKYAAKITNIVISEGVTKIGTYAFSGLTNAAGVEFRSNALTEIGDYAFSGSNLQTATGLSPSVRTIGRNAFEGCKMTQLTLPDPVASVGVEAFKNCSALTKVVMSSSVNMGNLAFSGCTALKNITAPIWLPGLDKTQKVSFTVSSGVQSIAENAFSGCTGLTGMAIPGSVTSIGVGAFAGCTALTGITIAAGNNYYSDVNGVLYNNDKTQLVCYPAGRTDKSFSVPDGVISILDAAFSGCAALSEITISGSVTTVAANVFDGCAALSKILVDQSSIPNSFAFAADNNLSKKIVLLRTENGIKVTFDEKTGSLILDGSGDLTANDCTNQNLPWVIYVQHITIINLVYASGITVENSRFLTNIETVKTVEAMSNNTAATELFKDKQGVRTYGYNPNRIYFTEEESNIMTMADALAMFRYVVIGEEINLIAAGKKGYLDDNQINLVDVLRLLIELKNLY